MSPTYLEIICLAVYIIGILISLSIFTYVTPEKLISETAVFLMLFWSFFWPVIFVVVTSYRLIIISVYYLSKLWIAKQCYQLLIGLLYWLEILLEWLCSVYLSMIKSIVWFYTFNPYGEQDNGEKRDNKSHN